MLVSETGILRERTDIFGKVDRMRKSSRVAASLCAVAVIGSVMAGCSGTQGQQPSSGSGDSPAPQTHEVSASIPLSGQIAEGSFYTAELPEGFAASEKDDTFEYGEEEGGTITVYVHSSTADDVKEARLLDEQFSETGTFTSSGLTYAIVSDADGDEICFITPYEDGCVEFLSRGIEQSVAEAFIKNFSFVDDAFNTWQESVQS